LVFFTHFRSYRCHLIHLLALSVSALHMTAMLFRRLNAAFLDYV